MFALCALALSVAVAVWGEAYKIEQFPFMGLAFRVMPPAKLLTEKERPPRSAVPRANPVEPATLKPAPQSAAMVFAPALQFLRLRYWMGQCRRCGECVWANYDAARTYFAYRPPPVLSIA